MRLLALSALVFLSCSGPASRECSPSTCTGCCDATGACQTGTSEGACGSGGLVCVQCGADNFCSVGFCVPRGGNAGGGGGRTGGGGGATGGGSATGGGAGLACGPQTCAGCCLEGVCQSGAAATACGAGGVTCASCSGTCSGGQCVGSTCNASNCAGCCNGNRCETGLTAQACGARGAQCTTCGSGLTCTEGVCTGGSTCNASNCAGCCSGNVCESGTSASACGAGGASCARCDSGQSCGAGVCSFVCNATTCPGGCCQNNVCLPGTTSAACGVGGGACTTCGGNQACSAGQCATTCNAATCPSGCCQGTTCLPGTMAAACGTAGASCASCSASQACDGTQCVFVCNAASCPSGCCQGNTCVAGTRVSACGQGGAACTSCGSGQSCSAQSCVGGGGPVGDGCDTAPLLTAPGTVSGSLTGYANDFTSTTSPCKGTAGLDRTWRVVVPVGLQLTAVVTPVGQFDPALSFVTGSASACVGASAACVAGIDVGGGGAAETLRWTNAGTTNATVFVIVDDYDTQGTSGAFSLDVSLALPTAGDTCAAPIAGVSGTALTRNTSGFNADYQGAGSGCAGLTTGADFVVSYEVPNNRSLTVRATPDAGLDVSISLTTNSGACSARSCVAKVDTGTAGVVEITGWNNTTGATQTVFAIIDTPGATTGSVTVLGTEGALLGCGSVTCPSRCCSGGACVAGTADSACGTGGAACSACASPAVCSANQSCSATDLPTGATCTSSSQCYQPVLGTAECRTTWPGGYCTGSCFLTEQVCGGFLSQATGWCTPQGECLKDCTSPGSGQSTCRSGYVCEFSNGAGSQGVCVPRCQQVPCTTGTCNASGYCR